MNIDDFTLEPIDFGRFGHGLSRPECVWIDDDGIWTSDARGGVSRLSPTGEPTLLGSGIGTPNGFSRRRDGSFVVAGLDDGAIYTIRPDGTTTVLLIAHRLSTVVGADRILVLDGGRVRAAGTHGELRATDELYQRLAAGQLVGTTHGQ